MRAGRPFALVVRGEPGIGKTALLVEAVAAATGLTIPGAGERRDRGAGAVLAVRALAVAAARSCRDALPPDPGARSSARRATSSCRRPARRSRCRPRCSGCCRPRPSAVPCSWSRRRRAAGSTAVDERLRFVARRLPERADRHHRGAPGRRAAADASMLRGLRCSTSIRSPCGRPRAAATGRADVPLGRRRGAVDAADAEVLARSSVRGASAAERRRPHAAHRAAASPGTDLERGVRARGRTLPTPRAARPPSPRAIDVRRAAPAAGRRRSGRGSTRPTRRPAERAGSLRARRRGDRAPRGRAF